MLEKITKELGLEPLPKPRDILITPREIKSGIRNDLGLPTDPSELISDMGLPPNPKEAARMAGVPQMSELTPKGLFK